MDNKFGKISRISACAALKDGKTILEDLSFTAPYKIMMPFEKENGGIQIMPLCASAGIMAGDSQEFSYHVKEGADLEVLSQSFEKIHKMDEGSAARTIEVQVDKNAKLYYYPQPVIPFAQSAFDSKMTIHLEEAPSRLFLLRLSPAAEMHTMNAFSTADSLQKSCCTEGTNSSIATTPATNRTKCPWKESECTRATHIWQTCFSLKSAAEMVKTVVRNPELSKRQIQQSIWNFRKKSGRSLTKIQK